MNSNGITLNCMLRRSARVRPNSDAVGDSRKFVSYRYLLEQSEKLASGLSVQGIKKGDRLGILMENRVEYVEIIFACSLLGAIVVPLNIRLHEEELQYIVSDSGCRLLFTSEKFLSVGETLISNTNHCRVLINVDAQRDGDIGNYANLAGPYKADVEITEDDPITLIYTSGTTGKPKGCILTHKSWIGNNMNLLTHFGFLPSDVYLAILPLFHVGGLGTILGHLHVGATNLLMEKYSPAEMCESIRSNNATTLFLVPPMLNDFLRVVEKEADELCSVRIIIAGAGLEPVENVQKVNSLFPHITYHGIYGQSECGNIVTAASRSALLNNPGCYGYELVNFNVKVVDDTDKEVNPGCIGELVVRGPSVMRGYWNQPIATSETLKGGWVHTGDLFLINSDDGTLEMVGRKKYLIKTGGENVYPREVELVLLKHPGIEDCAVFGVGDPQWGESIKACIVSRLGSGLDVDQLRKWCRSHLAGYKCPRDFEIVSLIPRNHSGKVLYDELRSK